MINVVKKIVGTAHGRKMKKIRPLIEAIAAFETGMKNLTNNQLKAQTAKFKEKLANGATLDDILPEAFATIREASIRILGIRPFDVQFIGGITLHSGEIAEMKTGEGKTLVAVAPAYLNALTGKGVHVVTVNDYLATRDAEWMGQIFNFLDISVGSIYHGQSSREKQAAYLADITYGQNNEFGFDYLRDNMKFSVYDFAQRPLNYAIVDEVDSILIDEARTPLIISGESEQSSDLYVHVNSIIPKLRKETDFIVDEKGFTVTLTEEGVDTVEAALRIGNLFDPENIEYLHHVNQALKAHNLYKREVNYMVKDDKIIIIDEFTGRTMEGRRWSDGLHQAVEAKENVPILEENRTLATISFQNLFRLYNKLSGMTGTAETEAEEFMKTYNLDTTVIPTNWPCIRKDLDDVIYKSEREKFAAIVDEIIDCQKRGQPALVGTASVEKSEAIHRILTRKGITHNVLNAKHHESEAYVVAQAGRKSAVTVATNMAGRGTDIILGGNAEMMARGKIDPEEDPSGYGKLVAEFKRDCELERREVIDAGGFHIIGTERHESRRIDNQLRGRAGRQGDPGSSRFFLSLEDDLLRIFGAERLATVMNRLGMEDGVPIEHKMVNRSIENAQKKVENNNFNSRKSLLEYDDVMNQQRKTIYALRKQVLEGMYMHEVGLADVKNAGENIDREMIPAKVPEDQIKAFTDSIKDTLKKIIIVHSRLTEAPPPGPDGELPEPDFIHIVEPFPDRISRQVYEFYGVKVNIDDIKDPKVILDELLIQVPISLGAQRERLLDDIDELIGRFVETHCGKESHGSWDLNELALSIKSILGVEIPELKDARSQEEIAQKIFDTVEEDILKKEKEMGKDVLVGAFRHFYLRQIDKQWLEHLAGMEHLRSGIGLRGYGNRDPKQEYKIEGYEMFIEMMDHIKNNVLENTFHVTIKAQEDVQKIAMPKQNRKTVEAHGAEGQNSAGEPPKPKTVKRIEPKVGRNDPCPCGSGKKFKKCCGR
ncbi:MAG: preprotein translocase subunit SecA [Deltaproteobacteria bacterium]|nr:preprotein translocase subunit SecA [Deltaproteobacteria bacterium]